MSGAKSKRNGELVPDEEPKPTMTPATEPEVLQVLFEGKPYLTVEGLVRRWNHVVRHKTLKNWRHLQKGPGHVKFAGGIYYPLDGVQRYERAHMNLPASRG